jgi:signal transduction histidine kinase
MNTSPQKAEHLLAAQNNFLATILAGKPLKTVLDRLIEFIEKESNRAICSILILNPERTMLRAGSAPSLSPDYFREIEGVPIGPEAGSCGTAVYRRQTVIVADIETDSLWESARWFPLKYGIKACTSMPILNSKKEVLGSFALYYREITQPTEYELQLLETSKDLAGIAIERYLREEQIKQIHTGLQKAVQSRDEFLSIGSHELKTPITTLRLQMESLKRMVSRSTEITSKEIFDSKLDTALRQINRLSLLVETMLNVSKINMEKISLQLERVNIQESINEVISFLEPIRVNSGSEIQVTGDYAPIEGLLDRFQLNCVITNLITNALKFGEGKPIEIALKQESGFCHIEVKDQGLGISPENKNRIFERFERVVSERNFGGFGVGLWLVREIAHAHGGKVEVSSTLGKGSTFRVIFPIRNEVLHETPLWQPEHQDFSYAAKLSLLRQFVALGKNGDLFNQSFAQETVLS